MPPGMPPGMMGPLSEDEKTTVPKVTFALIKRIMSYLKPYIFQFIIVFVTILLSAGIGLFPSIITGKIVDQALVGDDLALLIRLLLMAFACLMASQIIGIIESYINTWISQRIIFDMKNQMYDHLQYMPHSFFTTEKQGDIITRMNTDISGVSSVISNTLSSIVSNIATVVTTLVALFSMSWKLAIVGILVIPILIIPTRTVGKTRWKLLSESQAKDDELNQVINETLSVSGSMLVKIFTREKKEYEKFVKVNEEVTQLKLKESRSGGWFRVVMGMFTQVGPLLIYFAGGYLIINKLDTALTVGTITATVSLINRLYRPVESLLNIQVEFTRSLALFSRIFDYFDRENTIVSPENGLKPEIEKKDITFEQVEFSYTEDKPLLTDVNFAVPGAKTYAIVGPSGSGKSTIVNFIPRLYDVKSGKVSINGVDVRDMDLTYLRSHIGIVTQDTYLFNGTILDNLLYAKEDATMEEIENACKAASIHDFISNQPEGYNTQVGNRGLKLSGGEKQRISIARVILKDPSILILDEATSALDSISENAIQEAFETLMKDRTCIVIAHRLSTILKADSILVVKDGVIAESGTHDELLKKEGVYKQLYETQFRQAIDLETAKDQALDIQKLSENYDVKKITSSDITSVYRLAKLNTKYYSYLKQEPTIESLTEVITEMPEGTDPSGKFFVGFYNEKELCAVADIITGYPEANDAFIGWFMVDALLQGKGIGSAIYSDIEKTLREQGYDYIGLGVIDENSEGISFWTKQGYSFTGKEYQQHELTIKAMGKDI